MLALHSVPVCVGRLVAPVLLGLCLVGPGVPASPARGDSPAHDSHVAASYGQLPISFESNRGQTDPSVDFLAHGAGATVFLSSGDATLSLSEPASVVRVQPDGATPHPEPVGELPLPGVANYVFGTDPDQWHTDIPTYARVRYRDVYPGVDLIYYGNQGHMEYDFEVSPGADPTTIRLHFDGADRIHLDQAGGLVLQLTDGQLLQPRPLIFQDGPNGRESVLGGYTINDDDNVSFALTTYDRGRALTIDPVLAYSTLLGGSGPDRATSVAVDAAGQAYVTGATSSLDFPTTTGVVQSHLADSGAAFVTKLNASGSELVYSTYLGGNSGSSTGTRIAVDAAGNAYVAGTTSASDFPTTSGAVQSTFRGSSSCSGTCVDGFVSKLNPSGSELVYSTFLAGAKGSSIVALAIDAAGSAFVSGVTESADFPTTAGAFQTKLDGPDDAFVSRLNSTGTALVYSTYLGGSSTDVGRGIALDPADNAYIGGLTSSLDFPTTPGAFQRSPGESFITKLNPSGSALVYSTYLSGADVFEITVDTTGNAYLSGITQSTAFPTTSEAFQRSLPGVAHAFVTKLNSAGTGLAYSTYLGGSASENGLMQAGIAVDPVGNAYVTGITESRDFPVTPGAFQPRFMSGSFGADAFVTKLNPTGSGLVYSSYLSGSAGSDGEKVALDPSNNAYVVGAAFSSDFPTTANAFQTALGGPSDAFISKVSPGPPACGAETPPVQLQELVHADQGLASLSVTTATNVDVMVPNFVSGTTDSVLVTGTALDPTRVATFALHATDLAGNATDCTIGGGTPPPPRV